MNSDTPSVTVYSTSWCGSCVAAKRLLDARAIPYREVNLDDEPGFRAKLLDMTGRFTVPQIFIGEQSIGGFDQLRELDRSGRLAELVEQAA